MSDTQPTDESEFLAKAAKAKRDATGGKKKRAGRTSEYEYTAKARPMVANAIFTQTRGTRDDSSEFHDAIGATTVDIDNDEYKATIAALEESTGKPVSAPDRMLIAAQCILRDRFGIRDFHPVVELMVIGGDKRYHPDIRVRALGRAAPFVVPTLKSVEISGNADKPLTVITDTEMQERMLRKLGLVLEGEVLEEIVSEEDNDD